MAMDSDSLTQPESSIYVFSKESVLLNTLPGLYQCQLSQSPSDVSLYGNIQERVSQQPWL